MPGPDLDRILLEIISIERSLTPDGGIGEGEGVGRSKADDLLRTG